MKIRLELINNDNDKIVFGGEITEPQRLIMIHKLQHKEDIEYVASSKPLTETERHE